MCRLPEARSSRSKLLSEQISCEGLHAARCGAISGFVHEAWAVAAAPAATITAAAAAAAAAAITAPTAAVAASLLGARGRTVALLWRGEAFRGDILYCFSPASCWRPCGFFRRQRAIGSGRSDCVFVPSPVPVCGYCTGVDECTSVQGGAIWRHVWL